MLQNGVDVKAVQEVLGHEHLNTTEIYTHIDNESLRIAAKANPLSHIKIKGKIDEKSGAIMLFGRSFDFGSPDFDNLRKIEWTGAGGKACPILYLPKWPDDTVVQRVFAKDNERTRVLVTGASGFLGSRMAWFLEEKCGFEIYSPSHKDMEITEIDSCMMAVSSFKPDYVIHCAAISSTAFCKDNPEASRKTNIDGTCNVVCAAS